MLWEWIDRANNVWGVGVVGLGAVGFVISRWRRRQGPSPGPSAAIAPEVPEPSVCEGRFASASVFIAHAGADQQMAGDLHDALEARGVQAFVATRSLEPGDRWVRDIPAAQRKARFSVVLLSGSTPDAFYQGEEIADAISLAQDPALDHRVVPVHLDAGVEPPYGLRQLHHLDAQDRDVDRLADGLARLAGAPVPPLVRRTAAWEGEELARAGTELAALVPTTSSPFVIGRPLRVTDRLWGDSRRRLVTNIVADLTGGGSMNLVGGRRAGRTSTLNWVEAALRARGGCALCRLDFQAGLESERDFYARLWDQLPGASEEVPAADGAALVEALTQRLRRLRSDGIRPIALVDEFDRVLRNDAAFTFPHFYGRLRSLVTGDAVDSYLQLVIVSQKSLHHYFTDEARRDHLESTFPSYFPSRTLEPLTEAEAAKILCQPSVHRLTPDQVQLALAWARGGHPCRVQAAGEAMWRLAQEGRDPSDGAARYDELERTVCHGAE